MPPDAVTEKPPTGPYGTPTVPEGGALEVIRSGSKCCVIGSPPRPHPPATHTKIASTPRTRRLKYWGAGLLSLTLTLRLGAAYLGIQARRTHFAAIAPNKVPNSKLRMKIAINRSGPTLRLVSRNLPFRARESASPTILCLEYKLTFS
jgi:hypothetical protein